VTYNNQKCLKLGDSSGQLIDEKGEYELGQLYEENDIWKYCPGRFPDTIFEVVGDNYLNSLDLEDLEIMRNEIYARYHYVFEAGGKMDTYFEKQNWYVGMNEDVTTLLTKIEKSNIKSIRKIEKEKKTRRREKHTI